MSHRIARLTFFVGYIMSMMVDCLVQDVMGKEAYLKLVQEQWADIPPALWVGLIVFMFFVYNHLCRHARDLDDYAEALEASHSTT